jgi:cold shock protein
VIVDIDYLSLPPPSERIGTSGSAQGVVKWYKDEKGYGCISSAATSPWDIWCHFSSIEGLGFRSLEAGQRVDVHYERRDQDSFRYVATRVVALTG